MAISPWKIQPNTKDLSTPWIQPVDEYVASQIEQQKLYQRQRPVDEMQNKFKNGEVGFQQATDWFTNYQPKAVYQKEQQNLRQAQSDVTSSWRKSEISNWSGQYTTGQIDYATFDTKMHEALAWYPEDSAQYGETVNTFAGAYQQVLDDMFKQMEAIGGDEFVQFAQWYANKKKEGFDLNTPAPEFTYTPTPKTETPVSQPTTPTTPVTQNTGTTPGAPPVNKATNLNNIQKTVTKAVEKAIKNIGKKKTTKKKNKPKGPGAPGGK